MLLKQAKGQSVVASGLQVPRPVVWATLLKSQPPMMEAHIRLPEGLRTGSFRARDKVAVLSHSHGKHGVLNVNHSYHRCA
jgi:hypothetical protein